MGLYTGIMLLNRVGVATAASLLRHVEVPTTGEEGGEVDVG